jgi:hypothetical protein
MPTEIFIDGKPIEENCLSSVVTRRENAVDDCLLTANNEKGVTYLNALKLQSEVRVKYYWADKPGDTPYEVFRGVVVQINPSTTISGEIMSVTAYGRAVCLKQMRVANEYGLESKNGNKGIDISAFYDVNGYSFESNPDLVFEKNGESPWLFIHEGLKDTDYIHAPCYKGTGTPVEMGYSILGSVGSLNIANTIQGDICTSDANGGTAQSITVGLKTAGTGHVWNGFIKCALYLHSTLVFVGETEEHSKTLTETPTFFTFPFSGTKPTILPSTAYVVVVWSQSGTGGSPMVVFDNGSVDECHTRNQTYNGFPNPLIVDAHNNYKLSIYCTVSTAEPYYAEEYSWTFPHVSTDYEFFTGTDVHLTLRGKLFDGTAGHCDQISIEAQLFIADHWINMGEVMFTALKLRLRISQMSFTGAGIDKGGIDLSYATLKVQATISNSKVTLRHILIDTDIGIIPKYVEKILGGTIDSGYTLNTDYIYNELSEFKYLYFPYESAFDCIRDMINLLSAMRYGDGSDPKSGLHWIVLPTGELSGDDQGVLCIGCVGNHNVTGATGHCVEDVWKTYSRITPLEVKRNNIIEDFIQKEPEANYILVGGIFECPASEYFTEGHADKWTVVDAYGYASNDTNCKEGIYSTKLTISGKFGFQWFRWSEPLSIDFTKIWTRKNIPVVKFWFYADAETLQHKLIFYKDWNHYYEYTLPTFETGKWTEFEVKLDNEDWHIVGSPALTWSDIQYIGFSFYRDIGLGTSRYSLVDAFRIEGAAIRAAKNSISISRYGTKTDVIRDSLATSVGFDPNDDSSTLAQVAKMELLRSQVVLTTGKIQIELDPRILPGQLVHVHAGRSDVLRTHTYTAANHPHPNGYQSYFQIDQDFRIVELIHNFSSTATTTLSLVDDLMNSISIGPADVIATLAKVNNPDFQTKTVASGRTTKELDIDLVVLEKDYPSG